MKVLCVLIYMLTSLTTLQCATPTSATQLANAAHDDSDDDEPSDKKTGPLRPNGWSTYQASWLESDDTTADNNAADSAMMDFCNATNSNSSSNKQLGSGVVDADEDEKWHNRDNTDGLLSDNDSDSDNDSMDMHDDAASTANTAATSSNKDQIKLENDEKDFPDEVNTPDDVPARKRFARYRALRSFRSSPWDPQESLPRDYARIFQVCKLFQCEHDRI
jgi:pre-rRNA-processing protein TSR1